MNKASLTILVAGLALMGVGAGFLGSWHSRQTLSAPGLKLGDQPLKDESGALVTTNTIFLPVSIQDCTSESLPVSKLELGWLPKDTTYGRRGYRMPDGFEVMISAVLMGTDRTSIHKPDYCLPGQGWGIEKREFTTIAIEKPKPYALPVQKLTTTREVRDASGATTTLKGVYLYWFVGEDKLTATEKDRTVQTIRDLVTKGKLQRWAYVTCFAVCRPGEESSTFERMSRFLREAVPNFQLVSAGASASK